MFCSFIDIYSKPLISEAQIGFRLFLLPFPEPKKQSISTLEREWDTQSVELGTSPSCGGLRSVVRTRHQPGRSLGLSNSSTV